MNSDIARFDVKINAKIINSASYQQLDRFTSTIPRPDSMLYVTYIRAVIGCICKDKNNDELDLIMIFTSTKQFS